MYVIELHDDETDNVIQGTLAAHIGRHGSIEYAYQVEMYLQDVLTEGRWRRAYLKTANKVKAVWTNDQQTGTVQYLARTEDYDGEWVLPFVTTSHARIAVGIWGRDVRTDSEAATWAANQLSNAVTAIIMDRGEIRFAWESANGAPVLIARGPRR